ncbi:MAG: DUF3494 domain-containing protein [Actinobacteria bacterium]|nr:DUF3494 domain-containing protein [Actinomycetota bacterium]
MVRTRDTAHDIGRFGATPWSLSLAVVAVVAGLVLARPAAAATAVNLGTAGSYAVLAGSAITNTGPTTINGDVGIHPNGESSVTGFDTVTLNGQPHYGDAAAGTAKNDLTTAYDSAAGQPATQVVTELGGQNLIGGAYDSADGTFQLTGALTLNAQGDPNTVWIFQMDTTLTTASASSVNLVNGADACNVYWQVGSSATLGTSTAFVGNILAMQSITLANKATIRGRALARAGAVTMDTNTLSRTFCQTQVVTPSPSPSPTTSPSPSTSPTPSPTPVPSPSPVVSPDPVVSPSPSEVVTVPLDGTTGTPTDTTGTPTDTTGTPEAPATPDEPEAPVAAAPPASGTPQVPLVPSGPVPAGDGSTAGGGDGRATGVLLLPFFAGLVLYGTWRRRNA